MRISRKFANPIVSVLLFAGLWWTLAQLPARESMLGGVIRAAWNAMTHPARSCVLYSFPTFSIYRDARELSFWFEGSSQALPDRDTVAMCGWKNSYWSESGFAFPTSLWAGGVLRWYEGVPPLTDEEKRVLRERFADALAASNADPGDRELIGFLRQGDITVTRPIYSGYLKNTGLAAIFGAFLLSLAWMPDACRRFRLGTRALRLKRAQCRGCAYDIRGLPDRRCPECDETWSEEEAALGRL